MNNRNTSFTKSPVTPRTIYRSHFPSEAQYLDAERLIKSLMGYKIQAERDKEGRVMIDEVLDVLVREDQNLGFVDFEHLSEIFLRHNPVMFYIQGEYLVPSRPATAGLPIDPPDTLYFQKSVWAFLKYLFQGGPKVASYCHRLFITQILGKTF